MPPRCPLRPWPHLAHTCAAVLAALLLPAARLGRACHKRWLLRQRQEGAPAGRTDEGGQSEEQDDGKVSPVHGRSWKESWKEWSSSKCGSSGKELDVKLSRQGKEAAGSDQRRVDHCSRRSLLKAFSRSHSDVVFAERLGSSATRDGCSSDGLNSELGETFSWPNAQVEMHREGRRCIGGAGRYRVARGEDSPRCACGLRHRSIDCRTDRSPFAERPNCGASRSCVTKAVPAAGSTSVFAGELDMSALLSEGPAPARA